LVLGCLTGIAGCGSGLPPVAPVKGTVTWKGQPVAGASVMFMPGAGRPATGTTDAEGHYRLSAFGETNGAMLGQYKVTITKRVPISDAPYAPERSEIPPAYADAATSPLKAEVTAAGPNEFTFDLEGEIQ
jgi:hypothetical protein